MYEEIDRGEEKQKGGSSIQLYPESVPERFFHWMLMADTYQLFCF